MNWQKLILDLTDRSRGGYTQSMLAQKCGCGQSTISDLRRGATTSPNANLGLKLIALSEEMDPKVGA